MGEKIHFLLFLHGVSDVVSVLSSQPQAHLHQQTQFSDHKNLNITLN